MAKRSIEERLAQLDAQRQALKARLTTQERAKDTKRKILLGALMLHRLSENSRPFDKTLREWLQHDLPGFLSRPDDKTLFADLLTGQPPQTSGNDVPANPPDAAPTSAESNQPNHPKQNDLLS